ncbi:hypothetical protein H4R18_002729 [Coemansia javaensis]|uniref:Zn(2)-C6 fungal-type domain-containing protein n=1 Tax=Coemansia javaensis TaxID=2761396 RepID=A0A9W8H8W6_9FUNG|nr:hypothetical protein H4R18_002729 [Coemansia javaensis]
MPRAVDRARLPGERSAVARAWRRAARGACVRCRVLGAGCDGAAAGCGRCGAAGVGCWYPTARDAGGDIGTAAARNSSTPGWPSASAWTRLRASAEYLGETRDDEGAGAAQHTEQPAPAGPLGAALAQFPDDPGDERLGLPSSELLHCIADAVARSAAEDPQQQQHHHHRHNQPGGHMSGSSLLALGVLLQEHGRHLL